jgi:hypothetical protein
MPASTQIISKNEGLLQSFHKVHKVNAYKGGHAHMMPVQIFCEVVYTNMAQKPNLD